MTRAGAFLAAMVEAAAASPFAHPLLTPGQNRGAGELFRRIETHGGAILADDAGLGKSYVAAAVAAAYRERPVAPFFVVPPTLLRQWRELLLRFDLDAPIVSHETIARGGSPAGGEDEIVVVDEAHRFRNRRTRRFRALARRSAGARLLLVTATPVCNSLDDLATLLALVAPDDALAFAGVDSIAEAIARRSRKEIALVLQELVVRRTRAELAGDLVLSRLDRRVIRYPSPAAQIASRIASLTFPAASPHDRNLLRRFLLLRLESGVAAFRDSIRRQRAFCRRLLETRQRGFRLTRRDYARVFAGDADRLFYQEVLFPEVWMSPAGEGEPVDDASLEEEIRRLDALLAVSITDAKRERLAELVARHADERVIVFTGSVVTARALHGALAGRFRTGLASSRSCRIGDAAVPQALQVFDALRAGRLDAIVSTDMASEGLNLQDAGIVVHYDLSWNPVRLAQRNGRIDRIGQQRPEIAAFYFLPADEVEHPMLRVIAKKNRSRRGVVKERGAPAATGVTVEVEGMRATVAQRAGCELPLAMILTADACGVRRLWISEDGRCTPYAGARERAGIEPEAAVTVAPFSSEEMKAISESLRRFLDSRMLVPSQLGRSSPQARLLALLPLPLARHLRPLLGRRQRAGVELLLADLVAYPPDAEACARLRALLERELRLIDGLARHQVPLALLARGAM